MTAISIRRLTEESRNCRGGVAIAGVISRNQRDVTSVVVTGTAFRNTENPCTARRILGAVKTTLNLGIGQLWCYGCGGGGKKLWGRGSKIGQKVMVQYFGQPFTEFAV